MVRPVRMSFIAVSLMIVLFAMPVGISAKKKSSKRKSRVVRNVPVVLMAPVERSVPVIVTPPVLSSANTGAGTNFIRSEAPVQALQQAPAASAASTSANGSGIGDSEGVSKKPAWARFPSAPTAGSLIISEFRVRGPNGANDEFIEIYNDSGADHNQAKDGG